MITIRRAALAAVLLALAACNGTTTIPPCGPDGGIGGTGHHCDLSLTE